MPQISPEALAILKDGTLAGKKLKITDRPLDRQLYEEVAEVVKRLGGKWKGGRTQGFVFELDPAELWAITLETGEMPPDNPLDYFSSTSIVVERMIALVNPASTPASFLEPNAGTGALCKAAKSLFPDIVITGVELDEYRARYLISQGFNIHQGDFLIWAITCTEKFDLILMNPPFNNGSQKNVYIDHVEAALRLLSPTGLLISVVPGGFEYRSDKKIASFRALVEGLGGWRSLPDGAFKESGTGIGAKIVWINGAERPAEFHPNPPPDPEPEPEPEPEYPPLDELLDELERLTREADASMQVLKAELFSTGCQDLIDQVNGITDDTEGTLEMIQDLRKLTAPTALVELFDHLDPPANSQTDLEPEAEGEAQEIAAAPEPEFKFEPLKLKRKQKDKLTMEELESAAQGCLF